MQVATSVVRLASGVQISMLRTSAAAAGAVSATRPTVLFTHATGFCKEVWLPVFEELLKVNPALDLVAVDQRNHGDSYALNRHLLNNGTLAQPAVCAGWRPCGANARPILAVPWKALR